MERRDRPPLLHQSEAAPISRNAQRPQQSKAAPFRGRGGTDLRQPPTSSRKQSGPFPGPRWHRSQATPNVLTKAKRPLSGAAVVPISRNAQRPHESKAAPFRGRCGTDLRQRPTSSRKQSGPFTGPLRHRSHAAAQRPHESKAAPLRGRCSAQNGAGGIRTPVPRRAGRRLYACSPPLFSFPTRRANDPSREQGMRRSRSAEACQPIGPSPMVSGTSPHRASGEVPSRRSGRESVLRVGS